MAIRTWTEYYYLFKAACNSFDLIVDRYLCDDVIFQRSAAYNQSLRNVYASFLVLAPFIDDSQTGFDIFKQKQIIADRSQTINNHLLMQLFNILIKPKDIVFRSQVAAEFAFYFFLTMKCLARIPKCWIHLFLVKTAFVVKEPIWFDLSSVVAIQEGLVAIAETESSLALASAKSTVTSIAVKTQILGALVSAFTPAAEEVSPGRCYPHPASRRLNGPLDWVHITRSLIPSLWWRNV